MGSFLHGCARTTPRVRAELQASKASSRALAAQYGLNPKTVAKWRKRTTVDDAPMGPKARRSTVLSEAEEASIAELRRNAMLPLDDLLGRLLKDIPRLSRSALHRCLQRQGISRLPKGESDSKRGRFSETELGYVHVDSCEVRSAEGKRHLFVAVDRVTKLVVTHLYESANMAAGADFMARVVEAFPYRLHTVLTDNGTAFSHQPRYRNGATATYSPHVFDRVCRAHGVKHRLTKPYHPWTNGQAERMVRSLKEATVKRFHYDTSADLEAHLRAAVAAHNLARHLKGLRWRTPFRAVCDAWAKDPSVFKADPRHHTLGPHN